MRLPQRAGGHGERLLEALDGLVHEGLPQSSGDQFNCFSMFLSEKNSQKDFEFLLKRNLSENVSKTIELD